MRHAALLFFIVPALSILPGSVSSQMTQTWTNSFFTPTLSYPKMTTDASGDVIIVGLLTPSVFTVIKYNAAGVQQWAVVATPGSTIGANNNFSVGPLPGIIGIGADQSGNSYVACNYSQGIYTVAFTPSGATKWTNNTSYKGVNLAAFSMAVDAPGNVYFGGIENGMCATVKLSSGGATQWVETYSGTGVGDGYLQAVAADASGNVYVTGSCYNAHNFLIKGLHGTVSDNTADIITIKYGPSGNILWANNYNGGYQWSDYGIGLALDASANVYLIGATENNTSIVEDVLAYSTGGAQLWVNRDTVFDYLTNISVDPAGNIITAQIVDERYSLSKYTPAGSRLWTYTGDHSGSPYLAFDKQSNCYVAATAGAVDGYLIAEVSPAGALNWQTIYTGISGQYGVGGISVYTPASKPIGAVVYPQINVTGSIDVITSPNTYYLNTVQYTYKPGILLAASSPDSLTGAAATLANPAAARLANYPNPFRGATTITYTLPQNSHVVLQVYDNAGRPVATLVNQDQTAGTYTLPFGTAGRLAAGIYQYRIIAQSPQGTFTQTKQMIIE